MSCADQVDRVSDSEWPLRAAQFLKPPALPGDIYLFVTIIGGFRGVSKVELCAKRRVITESRRAPVVKRADVKRHHILQPSCTEVSLMFHFPLPPRKHPSSRAGPARKMPQ